MRMPAVRCVVLAASAWACLATTPPASAAAPDPELAATLARADRLLRQGSPDSVLILVAPVIAQAQRDADAAVELMGRLHEAGALALSGNVREAEVSARRAQDLADLRSEPGAHRMATRWLGYALLAQGRAADARAAYEGLLEAAAAAGDKREEAYARMGLAYLVLGQGDAAAALAGYEQAAPLFHAVGETAMEMDCLIGLARALGREGRYGEMQVLYRRIIREGEAAGLARVTGYALNNLGTYEYQAGDPELAVGYWTRSLQSQARSGDLAATITPRMNLALAMMELGAFDDAVAALDTLSRRCREAGYAAHEAAVLSMLAGVERARGRTDAATEVWRRISTLPNAERAVRIDAVLQILRSMTRDDHCAAALALGDSLEASLPGDSAAAQRAEIDQTRAEALAACGRHAEALPLAARALASFRAAGFRQPILETLTLLARSERALAAGAPGLADSALVHLEQARQRWSDLRALPRDPRWREQRSVLGSEIHLELAGLLLEFPDTLAAPERTRAAFDALQDYKARSLLERMLGPDDFGQQVGDGEPPLTLARLQEQVLSPGEVLLDYYVGRRGSLLFAVTADACRVVALPGSARLRDQVGLFLELIGAGRAAPEAAASADIYDPALRSLNRLLLEPVAAEIAGAHRVVVAADSWLNLAPFELLLAEPRGDGRAVMRVPSAAVLAHLRDLPADVPGGSAVVLQAASAGADEALPGAAAEVRSLRRRYRGVEVLQPGCDAGAGVWTAGLAGHPVLHIPAHTETFDQRPWNSRIVLGQGEDGAPCWLLSADVAGMTVATELVVLSGCSSAGGRIISGEGVVGLTGAFLSAGARVVVASLWDVDDAVTADLMQRFYHGLARGLTIAGALDAARRELAAAPATAAPSHWAGFVVVGDGSLTVPLPRRTAAISPPAIGLALASLAVVAALLLRRRVISRRRGSLS